MKRRRKDAATTTIAGQNHAHSSYTRVQRARMEEKTDRNEREMHCTVADNTGLCPSFCQRLLVVSSDFKGGTSSQIRVSYRHWAKYTAITLPQRALLPSETLEEPHQQDGCYLGHAFVHLIYESVHQSLP